MKTKEFKQLNKRVITWAAEKGILEKATPLTQMNKTLEEVKETEEALFAQSNKLTHYKNSKGELKNTKDELFDGFGDSLVTILIGCELQNINPLEALESALNIIEKRTGKIINGTFVKDE